MKYRLTIIYSVLVLATVFLVPLDDLFQILIGRQPGGRMIAELILLGLGMVLITHGGDLFTDSAVAIAKATRIPPVIVGATVVSMATTFPEFMVSFTGAINGVPEFAVGNALGSCCCNIGLIVGTCALLKGWLAKRRNEEPGIPANRVTLLGSGSFMLAAGVAVLIFSFFDSGNIVDKDGEPAEFAIVRWQAIVLLMILAGYFFYSVRLAFLARYEPVSDEDEEIDPISKKEARLLFLKQIGAFLLGAVLVFLGSRLLVKNAESIAIAMEVPELWIGLTVLAIGTSLPEYTISLIAVIKGHGSLGLGNIIGANVLNICWVVATCALVDPLVIKRQTVFLDGPVVMLLMSLLIFGPLKKERVTATLGGMMVAVYVAYYAAIFLFFGN
ncbi:MAG: calcium/sodium antiporter [Planctomycetaceae bacterium]